MNNYKVGSGIFESFFSSSFIEVKILKIFCSMKLWAKLYSNQLIKSSHILDSSVTLIGRTWIVVS